VPGVLPRFIGEETGALSPAPGVAVSGDIWIDLVPVSRDGLLRAGE
jgi:hypothetical protein